jgi:type VI secretion system protein ImpJ
MSVNRMNPVAWSEGMFLRPQHLQHHALFSDERLRYHLRSIEPFHWGVRELSIDDDALSDHRFAVLRLDAVLPSGIVAQYPGNVTIQAREFDPGSERVDVMLGLRELSATEPNVAPAEDLSGRVRYRVQTEDLPDLNRGGYEAPIELIYPNLRIFFSGEENQLEGHEAFKLAEIKATGDLKTPFALSDTYVPPLISVEASPLLFDAVTRVASQIAAKVRVVAGRTTTIAIADLPKMWMRYTLARMTPVLRHLLSTGETRPFDLYTALVDCAGSLGSFSHLEPVELPLYDHADLYRCFNELIEFIATELGESVPTRFSQLDMPWDDSKKTYATDQVSLELADPRNSFFLAVKAAIDAKDLDDMVVNHGKASSRSGVTPLVMLNVAGLRIESLPAAPTEIAGEAGFQYYRVEPHGKEWTRVREEGTFALSLGKLEEAKVRLYVVRPQE